MARPLAALAMKSVCSLTSCMICLMLARRLRISFQPCAIMKVSMRCICCIGQTYHQISRYNMIRVGQIELSIVSSKRQAQPKHRQALLWHRRVARSKLCSDVQCLRETSKSSNLSGQRPAQQRIQPWATTTAEWRDDSETHHRGRVFHLICCVLGRPQHCEPMAVHVCQAPW